MSDLTEIMRAVARDLCVLSDDDASCTEHGVTYMGPDGTYCDEGYAEAHEVITLAAPLIRRAVAEEIASEIRRVGGTDPGQYRKAAIGVTQAAAIARRIGGTP